MTAERLVREDRELLVRCREAILGIEPLAEVILYGSRATGHARPDSDYDLLVLVDGDVSMAREEAIRDRLYDIELDTGAVLTLFLESKARWQTPVFRAMPFVQAVERDGVAL